MQRTIQLKIYYLISLVLLTVSYPKIYQASWGKDEFNENKSSVIALYKLSGWQIQNNNHRSPITLPFFTSDEDSLILSNVFELPADSIRDEVIFKSLGFKGVIQIFINGNLLVSKPNNSAPFQVSVNKNFLKPGHKNSIKIYISHSSDLNTSFPVFTNIFTEPEYIGVTRPFFMELTHPELITNFKYSIQFEKLNPDFNYTYSVNSNIISTLPKTDGLMLEQKITDEANNTVSHRTISISRNNNTVTGGLSLLPSRLWSPDRPNFLTISFTLNRYAQPLLSVSKKVGLRSLRSNKNNILLNNSVIPVRGISYYENLKNKKDSKLSHRIYTDLQTIKNDGFNAVRFVSHVPDERFLSIADTLGLMIFMDIPVKRYPGPAFKQDILLENIKETATSTSIFFKDHPSFVAIGLGEEVLLSDPATSKFFIILDGSIERMVPFLTYISPVPEEYISVEQAADFYMLDIYDSITGKQKLLNLTNIPYTLVGKAAMSSEADYQDVNDENFDLNRKILINKNINTITNKLRMQGGFLESYMDWYSKFPTHQTLQNANPFIVHNGYYDTTFTKNRWTQEYQPNPWNYSDGKQLTTLESKKSSNIFSLTMFFSSLIFFFFYRRYPRLSENYRRSLKHPYGFYVEMRERRIIPVFNSFIVGVNNALLMTIFISAYIYYYNNSFLVQEFLSVVSIKKNIYDSLIQISQSEFSLIPFVFVWLYLYPIVIGLILKTYGLFSRAKIRLRQALAIGMWSGSPLIFFLPVSIAAYHLILNGYSNELLYIFAFFVVWIHFRLINGIRVLVLAKFRTIFLLLLLSYMIPFIIFSIFFSPQPMWSDYLITLFNSHNLF